MGKSKIIIIVLLVSLCGAWLYFSNQAEKNQIHAINKTMDEEYQTIVGILNQDYVSEAEWNQVSGKLGMHFDPNQYPEKYQKYVFKKRKEYPDLPVIETYVKGMNTFYAKTYPTNVQQYKAALNYLDKIPSMYNGILADRMAVNHRYVKHMYDEAKGYIDQIKADKAAEKAANIEIGDSESKIVQLFGSPQNINTTTVDGGEYKQYVYSGDRYVYTMNGIIIGFQNIQHQS